MKYKTCWRFIPHDNLMLKVHKRCIDNPFSYSFSCNDTFLCNGIECGLIRNKIKNNVIFFTIADNYSMKYIINSYKIFYIPYNIKSLITIVNDKSLLLRCRIFNIFCIYNEWPTIINQLNTAYRSKMFYLKYYYIHHFLHNHLSILYVDSDVLFLQNCLRKIINRPEDLILLKSQLNSIFGNAGIMYVSIICILIEE